MSKGAVPASHKLPTLSWFKSDEKSTDMLLRDTFEGVLMGSELEGKPAVGAAQLSQRSVEDSLHAQTRSVECVGKLLGRFHSLSKELSKLSKTVNRKLLDLQGDVNEEETHTQNATADLEDAMLDATADFERLEGSIGQLSRTATHIGERLYAAEVRRQTAQEALAIIDYMQQFSVCSEDFDTLPSLFHDKDMLAEAAGAATRLLSVADELTAAKHRGADDGVWGGSGAEKDTTIHGSLERAALRLKQYCNLLENRVVSRFDGAVQNRHVPTMQECARIVAEFNRESVLIQRYISQLPMFMNVEQLGWGGVDGSSPPNTDLAAELGKVYKGVLSTVKDEVMVLESVFPSADLALESLIQRVMEQRVALGVEATLTSFQARGEHAGEVERIQEYLKLLTQVYQRTSGLATRLESVCRGEVAVLDRVYGLFAEYMKEYPSLEVRLLQQLYQQHNVAGQPLSLSAMAQVMEWNREAVDRCVQLSPESARPRIVRLLFVGTSDEAMSAAAGEGVPGCLLEQSSRHVTEGLQAACQAYSTGCEKGSSALLAAAHTNTVSAVATKVARQGIGQVLNAVSVGSEVVMNAQIYYVDVVQAKVSAVRNEETDCKMGLAAYIKSMQAALTRSLNSGLTSFFRQAEGLLSSLQKKTDFLTGETGIMPEAPTTACHVFVAVLCSALKEVPTSFSTSNQEAFNSEMAERTHSTLMSHLTRFTFSQTGALRLKRDVSEYTEAVAAMGCPRITEVLDAELKAMVSILIISPSSLLGVVDGSLRMSHREALRFIQLREDFKSARVGNKTLAVLFASE